MTPIQHSISVDIQKHAKRQIVYMKQGDAMSRELLIFFYNGGVVWSVPSEITSVSLSYCKADKVHGCYDHIVDEVAYVFNSGRTSVTMAIHPQVLTAAGNVICELKLCNASGHALNTFNFVINCEQSPHAMGQKSEGYWNNVFDGATFTPQISSDGVLSWTNDKGLPNPDPIDLKEFVVDPSDIPVTTMEIVTSENVAENANADDKLLTPAAAQALIDWLLPSPIVLTPSSNFQYSAEVWSKTKNYTAGDYFFNNQNGSAGVIGIPHIYVCVNSFTGNGTPLSTRVSAGDVNDLGEMLSLPSGLTTMTQYAASISRGTLKILLGNVLIHQFQIAAGVVSFNGLIAGAARTFSISYDTSTGAISKINYATAVL